MNSRLDNSIRNIKYSVLNAIIIAILPMFTRTVFIYTLGKSYLGIDSVFANIVSLLEMVNIGIGTAITYSVYKPIAENNIEKCKTLFRLYRNVYWIMGVLVAVLGIAVIPFFNVLLKNIPNIPEDLRVIYFIILFSMVSGYFFADKQCVLLAHQKNYIITKYKSFVVILVNVIEIIALFLTKQYLVYLVIQSLQNLCINILVSRKVKVLYPFIREKKVAKLERSDRDTIIKNTSALILNRAGSLIINGTDNLVLSSVIGVTSVGLYSNYFVIKNCINNFAVLFTNQLGASIGNFVAVKNDPDKMHILFQRIFFVNYLIYSFCSVCLIVLFQPFITMWIGTDFLLDNYALLIIVANFFFIGMQNAIMQFKGACGLFWQDRYRIIIEAMVNLLISILLAKMIGLAGVFLGTLVSHFLVSFWVEAYITYKYAFQMSSVKYYLRYGLNTLITAIVIVCTYSVINLLNLPLNWFGFFARAILTGCMDLVLHVVIFYRCTEFQYLKGILVNRLKIRGK